MFRKNSRTKLTRYYLLVNKFTKIESMDNEKLADVRNRITEVIQKIAPACT